MSAKGGITEGKSHKEGGIPMQVKSTGQHVELEGGEGVINKRNMASEEKYEFEGKDLTICEIASEINSKGGNGVKIDCDDITGKKYKYEDGGVVFIPYGNDEIMYSPHFEKYYANDEEFDTLEEAQKFIDSGKTPDHIREAYRRGLFKDGGKTNNTIKTDDYDTATSMAMGGFDVDEATAVSINEGFKRGGSLEDGTKHEMEHKATINKFKRKDISTRQVAKAIAKDHLKEDKNYYKKLDILEKSTLAEILSSHSKSKKKNNAIKKYKQGGSVTQKDHSHPVHLVFNENYLTPLYNEDGKQDGDVLFDKDVLVHLDFVRNNGKTTHLRFINTSKYVIVPNEIITITGFNKMYSSSNNQNATPYSRYMNYLSETDIHILEMLRDDINFVKDNTSWTMNQKIMFSNFRGVNIANQLSEQMITKLYAILFKEHSIEHPIKNLYLSNVGAGNILNYAPIYLHHIIVANDKNEFEQVEDKICRIVNMESYTKKWNQFNVNEYKDTDAMIYCFSESNPISDGLTNELNEHEKMRVAVGICEFSSMSELDSFVKGVKSNASAFKTELSVYKIDEPITSKGKHTLIYVLKR